MRVEETMEPDQAKTDEGLPGEKDRPERAAKHYAVVEAAYILEALRK